MSSNQTRELESAHANAYPTWVSAIGIKRGLSIYPHQIEAIDFSLTRESSYLGLDPGLGKSVVAALLSKLVGPPILVVTPPFLVSNITAEFAIWAPTLRLNTIGKKPVKLGSTDVLLIPDSILTRNEIEAIVITYLQMWGECESTLIVDEAHRFKNEKSKRAKALFKVARFFDKKTLMSGTPMPNRPMELFPILSTFAPETIDHMDYWEFGKKYCDGHQKRIGWDRFKGKPKLRWDFSGSSNIKELGRKVIHPSGSFMLRIKKDRLKLPPKIEEIFIVSKSLTPHLASIDRAINKKYESADDLMKYAIGVTAEVGKGEEDLHLMTYRRLLSLEKVKPTAEYIDAILSETDESLLVFGVHIEALEELYKATAAHKPFLVTGKTPMGKRQGYVNEFQTSGKDRRLFIGNIQAMGVGFTLTKATRVIFMEFSWVPGDNDQASDRAHRIGQADTVYVQYVVYKDSIDQKVIEAIMQKRKSMRFI